MVTKLGFKYNIGRDEGGHLHQGEAGAVPDEKGVPEGVLHALYPQYPANT